ncbi:M23 family metallopeptidase [Virgibacillus sp. MG-45]|uniref:M23 family metallopeptidase n=1 Tax=Virgibacillus sp. MG-45 TaxID=3102791 RepID=UPI002EDB6F27
MKSKGTSKMDKNKYIHRFMIAAVFLFSFAFAMPVAADDDQELQTVYHVYVNDDYVGKIDNKEVVQSFVDQKVETAQQTNKDLSLTIGEEITYIPEKVFRPSFDNDKVLRDLNEKLTVKALAIELKLGDDVVGYFNSEKDAQQLLTAYKAKYVDQAILDKLEAAKQSQELKVDDSGIAIVEQPNKETEIEVGDAIIKDVSLSKEVSLSEQKVSVDQILTEKQGMKMLEKGTLTEQVHKVDSGEVLGSIAGKYDLTTKKLLELNPSIDEDTVLQIGQELQVTEYKPFVHVVLKKEHIVEEKVAFETEVKESEDMFKGDEKVKQEGKDGKKVVHYAIEEVNGNIKNKEVLEENVIDEPVKKVVIKGTKVISSRGTGNMQWPTVGGYISSKSGYRWGSMHKGIDIARPSNRSILAADNGVVVSAGYDNGGYGNKIVINHNNGLKTIYAHMASISVRAGQTVQKGMKIGVMGSTGNSTGVHLHFEVYKNGALQNPLNYIQ